MSQKSLRNLQKGQSKKLKPNIFTIIFNRIEPLGYHVLDYFVRLEMQGQSWESPIIQGGQYQQINIRSSIRKDSKIRQQETNKAYKIKKWVVQARGSQQLSGVLKFIEKKQESQRFKGKTKIDIKNQGKFQLYIFDQQQQKAKLNQNQKSSIIFRKDSQNGSKNKIEGKRIAYIQYEVFINNSVNNRENSQRRKSPTKQFSTKSIQGNIFQTNFKNFEHHQQQQKLAKAKPTKQIQMQQQRMQFNFPISEEASILSQSQVKENISAFEGSLIEKIQEKQSQQSENQQYQSSLVNKLIELNQSMDKELRYRKDEQQVFSRIIQQESLLIESLKGVNGKSKNKLKDIQKAKKILSSAKNSLKFKGRRTRFSQNPEKFYDGKNHQSQQYDQSFSSNYDKTLTQPNALRTQTEFGKKLKQQTIKSIATLYNFNVQCDAKPKSLQIYEINTKNCQQKSLLKVKSKNQYQFTWDNQIHLDQDLNQDVQVRAKISGTKGQNYEGTIQLKDQQNCAILYKINNKQSQNREIALLRYRKKALKLVQTKFHQLIQMPQKTTKKQEEKKSRNKISQIQQLQNESEQNQEDFDSNVSLKDEQENQYYNDYQFLTLNQKEKNSQGKIMKPYQQRQNVVRQKINQVRSMFFPSKKPTQSRRVFIIPQKNEHQQVPREFYASNRLQNGLKFQNVIIKNQGNFQNGKNKILSDNRNLEVQLKTEDKEQNIIRKQQQHMEQYPDIILNARQKWLKHSQEDDLGRSQIGISEPQSPNRFSRNSIKKVEKIQNSQQNNKLNSPLQTNKQLSLASHKENKDVQLYDSKYYTIKNCDKQKLEQECKASQLQFHRSLTEKNQQTIQQFNRFSTLNTYRRPQKIDQQTNTYNNEHAYKEIQNNLKIPEWSKKDKKLTMVTRAVHDNIIPEEIYSYYLSKKQRQKKIVKRNESNNSSKSSNYLNKNSKQVRPSQKNGDKPNNTTQFHFPIVNQAKKEQVYSSQISAINLNSEIINANRFSESGATISKKPNISPQLTNKYQRSTYQDQPSKLRLKTIQVENNTNQTQILIHLININLQRSNPLTGKYITMEVYPHDAYQTETLTCNKRLIWRGKGYSFRVLTSQLTYQSQSSLIIKLYEEVSSTTMLIGKMAIPLALLVDSGQIYQGRITSLDLETLGDILLQFKVLNQVDLKSVFSRKTGRQQMKSKLRKKGINIHSDMQQIGKISRRIQKIYDKYIPSKKRSKTLATDSRYEKSQSSLSPDSKKQRLQANQTVSSKKINTKKQKSIDYSTDKLNEYFNDPSFVDKLIQLKRKCKHLTHANCKGCQNEQSERRIIRSHKKNFKAKKIIGLSQGWKQEKDLRRLSPKIQVLKANKKYLYED